MTLPDEANPAQTSNGFARWLLVLAAAVVVVSVVGYRVLRTNEPALADTTPAASAAAAPPASIEPPIAAAAPSSEPVSPPAAAVSAAASAELAAVPVASAAAPVASAAATTPGAAAAPGMYSVTLKSIPPKARFFRFGKEVGTAPFVLQLPLGERRAYEAGLPGRVTRKVVVDGTKSEITVGLSPQ